MLICRLLSSTLSINQRLENKRRRKSTGIMMHLFIISSRELLVHLSHTFNADSKVLVVTLSIWYWAHCSCTFQRIFSGFHTFFPNFMENWTNRDLQPPLLWYSEFIIPYCRFYRCNRSWGWWTKNVMGYQVQSFWLLRNILTVSTWCVCWVDAHFKRRLKSLVHCWCCID